MFVYHQLEKLRSLLRSPTCVALGNFDGCHLGHQALFRDVLATAKQKQAAPAILTFFPHPSEILRPTQEPQRILTTDEKLTLFEEYGFEHVMVVPFSKALSVQEPETFVREYLQEGLRPLSLHVGEDFHFGKDRSGDVGLLRTLAEAAGTEVAILPPYRVGNLRVSSTELRNLLKAGQLAEVHRLMGRPFKIQGHVEQGEGRGKTLLFPTANVVFPTNKLTPKKGVYFVEVLWQREVFPAICNLGTRPTFEPQATRPVLEVHLLQFSGQLYNESLEVRFLEFLREEMAFPSLEALRKQIEVDIQWALSKLTPSQNPMFSS